MHPDSLLSHFFQFLSRPDPDTYEELTAREKLPMVAILSVFAVAAGILAGVIPGMLQKAGLIEPLDLSKMKQMVEVYGRWGIVLIVCVVAPILEETFFRWHLGSARLSATFFAIVLSLIIIAYVTPGIPLINFLLAFFTTLGLTALWLNKNPALKNWLELRWRKYFGLIFYLTALIFALFHLTNYNPSPRQLAYAPLIVLPQFAAGLFFGFTRIRYGLLWSMLMHGIYNTVLISTALLTGDL